MFVASSFLLNCRPSPAGHCPHVDDEAGWSKRVGSFEVEGGGRVVTQSWSAALFLCGTIRVISMREHARSE